MTPEGDLVLDGRGATTTFVCAGYDYDHDVAQPLLSLLPPVLHVPADPVGGGKVAALVTLLAGELGTRDAGARAAVARLIDLLLIHAVRAWSATAGEQPSWLRALNDPVSRGRSPCCTSAPRSRGRSSAWRRRSTSRAPRSPGASPSWSASRR